MDCRGMDYMVTQVKTARALLARLGKRPNSGFFFAGLTTTTCFTARYTVLTYENKNVLALSMYDRLLAMLSVLIQLS